MRLYDKRLKGLVHFQIKCLYNLLTPMSSKIVNVFLLQVKRNEGFDENIQGFVSI